MKVVSMPGLLYFLLLHLESQNFLLKLLQIIFGHRFLVAQLYFNEFQSNMLYFLYAGAIRLSQHLLWSHFNCVDLLARYDGSLTRVVHLENTTMQLFRGESFIAREKVSS